MSVNRPSVRPTLASAAAARRVVVSRPAQAAPARPKAAVPVAATALDGFKNEVVKTVAYAQQAQTALEALGRAYNAGQADRAAFEQGLAAFNQTITDLRALKAEGKAFNAPFWRPSGFKVDRYFREVGAEALLTYRPPTLGAPTPVVPDAERVFNLKLESLKKAADDAVNPEAGLTALLADAQTPQQLDQLLKAGRKGHRIGIGVDYWTECSQAFFTKAHDRREAITPPTTFDSKLASLKLYAEDAVSPEKRLIALLPEAQTVAQVNQILAAGRKGHRIGVDVNYWTEASRALFEAAHARREALEPPTTFDAKLESLKRYADDAVNPESRLIALLDEAETPQQIEQIRKAGRKGYRIGVDVDYWTECSQALFAKAHTRELQMTLAASVPAVSAPDRVKFALQPLPAFDTHESYSNYAVKSAAYALLDMADVRAAREAFKAKAITERELLEAEDRLELSLKLVGALRAHAETAQAAQWKSAGFDAEAFWAKYQIEESAKQLLG
jgi:ribulose bisphosphate carboxylase small subunit